MKRRHALLATTLPGAALAASTPAPAWLSTEEQARRKADVTATETAFAASMAARDPKAFQSFLAPDTVFGMGRNPAMGIEAVMKVWLPFFEGAKAPFSWKPDFVMLAPPGELAYSSGPVFNPEGKLINRFHSTWRRKAAGGWEIVFDQGEAVCGA